MSPLVHRIYISTLVSIVVLVSIFLAYKGFSYYTTSLEEGFYHPDHDYFKPSGLFGHGLGIIGTLLILIGEFGYIARNTVEVEIHADEKTIAEPTEELEETTFKQKLNGRMSVASYSNLSDYRNSHGMRYAFSFRGSNLKNSRFSTENYITFRHTIGEWDAVKANLGNALKVYALSDKYDFDQSTSLTLGRKNNSRISSMGVIDGLQFEKGLGQFLFGAIVGSRPDHVDYSPNFDLFQVGAYTSFGISRIPAIKVRATLRANLLQTSYLNSRIIGLRLSREIIKRKLNGDIYFRYVDYEYKSSKSTVHQNIAGINLSLRLLKIITL